MIGPLVKIIRTSNSFKNVLRYFGKIIRKSNLVILWFEWLIALYHEFSYLKTQLFQRRTKWCCVFLLTQLQHITMQENRFGVFARPLPLVRATPQLTITPSTTTCAVDDFQYLIYCNSQPPEKFTRKPKIVGL